MAKDKRERRDGLETQLDLQELETTPLPTALDGNASLMELLMEQIAVDFDALPTPAQLGVLRAIVPEVLSELDANDRAFWIRELLGVHVEPGAVS